MSRCRTGRTRDHDSRRRRYDDRDGNIPRSSAHACSSRMRTSNAESTRRRMPGPNRSLCGTHSARPIAPGCGRQSRWKLDHSRKERGVRSRAAWSRSRAGPALARGQQNPRHSLRERGFRTSATVVSCFLRMAMAKKKPVDPQAHRVAELVTSGPLAGKLIVVTRAHRQADDLCSLLKQFGADVIEAPVIDIREPDSYDPLDTALQDILQYDWLILTSVNGVEAMFSRLEPLGLSVDSLQHLKIAAIGPATEERIQDHGLVVDIVPPHYVAEEVVRALRKLVKGEKVLLVRAKIARDVIPDELGNGGAEVDVAEAYQTTIPEDAKRGMLRVFSDNKLPDAITFTSSSTVKNFFSVLLGSDIPSKLSHVKFASIGPVTSDTLREYGLPVHIEADEYTMEGLAQALVRLFGN